MDMTVAQLASKLSAELVGDGSIHIRSIAPVDTAGRDNVTFAAGEKFISRLKDSNAVAVILDHRIQGLSMSQLIVKNVNAALIQTLEIFAPALKGLPPGIDPTAKVASNAIVAPDASIGPYVTIGESVTVGEKTIISAGCRIGENSKIGKNCRLDGNVVVYHNCVIGNNVIIQANTTIGSTGFGYAFIDGAHRLIPHNGGVIIEDFVEIGANSCIDRAKFGNTIIGAGTKIDNFVQIAHNVVIGKCCLIAALSGIAGSSRLGDGVVLGGRASVIDNINVGDGVMVAAESCVTHNTPAGQKVFGMPATNIKEAFKIIALTRQLPKTVEQLRQLVKRVEELENAKNNTK
jgi:UDP-3-O-[3-hydroxymyristoyl] glucosamine N-acyltransferase